MAQKATTRFKNYNIYLPIWFHHERNEDFHPNINLYSVIMSYLDPFKSYQCFIRQKILKCNHFTYPAGLLKTLSFKILGINMDTWRWTLWLWITPECGRCGRWTIDCRCEAQFLLNSLKGLRRKDSSPCSEKMPHTMVDSRINMSVCLAEYLNKRSN